MMLSNIALAGIPLLVAAVIAYGALRGVAVYDAFVEGAKKGLSTVIGILPYIGAAMLLISLLRSSGVLDILTYALKTPLAALGLPEDTLPLLMLRPISGSASLAALEDILKSAGADSLSGRIAAAMMGSTETVLYTISVYLGAAALADIYIPLHMVRIISDVRHVQPAVPQYLAEHHRNPLAWAAVDAKQAYARAVYTEVVQVSVFLRGDFNGLYFTGYDDRVGSAKPGLALGYGRGDGVTPMAVVEAGQVPAGLFVTRVVALAGAQVVKVNGRGGRFKGRVAFDC